MVITTDGMENASKEFDYSQIKKLVEQQTEAGWEFIFLGANIDAIETAGRFGIRSDRASNFHADSEGVAHNHEALSETVCYMRKCCSMPTGWDDEIKADYSSRKVSKKR